MTIQAGQKQVFLVDRLMGKCGENHDDGEDTCKHWLIQLPDRQMITIDRSCRKKDISDLVVLEATDEWDHGEIDREDYRIWKLVEEQ